MLLKTTPLVLLLLAAFARADGRFKSRPDLTVPQWNITAFDAEKVYDAYVFVTPYSGPADNPVDQPGAYIYTSQGDLVWSSFGYFGGISFNLQAAELLGQNVLYAWEGQFAAQRGRGFVHIKILDSSYNVVKEVRGGNHKLIDIHEFHSVDGRTAYIESYNPVQADLSDFYDDEDIERSWVVDAVIQELDLETGELLFEWNSLDFVSPEHSVLNLTSEAAGDGLTSESAWDYFHINSVDKSKDGDYLVSSRHTSTIYKISGETGKVIWRLSTSGDSDLEIVGDKFTFQFQHHARFLEEHEDGVEVISFFDNNAYSKGHSEPESALPDQLSSGKIIRVDNKRKTVELLKQFNPPKDHPITAKSQGSLHTLPNGNSLINWGSSGAITEYSEDGEVLFHAKLDSGKNSPYVQSYRAFKFPWEGASSETIAVAREGDDVYVSWNGDTKTCKWQVLDSDGAVVTTAWKTGFETKISVEFEGEIFVRALGEDDQVLSSTLLPRRTLIEQLTGLIW